MFIGFIYKLSCSETGLIYFGSSRNPKRRFSQHKNPYNSCMSRKLINPVLSIIERVESDNELEFKKKLLSREKYYISNNILKSYCVNKHVPLRTKEEYINFKKREDANFYIKRNLRTRKDCPCGGIYIQRNLKTHLQSNKHIEYEKKNNVDSL